MALFKSCPNFGQNIKGTMKNMFKKIVAVSAGLLVGGAAFAQNSQTRTTRFLPLLTGYNVLVASNSTVGFGVTNTLYTSYKGQILHSLTNDVVNGTYQSNILNPDAFQMVSLVPDANGDINANAALVIAVGNTNWIPIAVTNSVGQWFIPTLPYTTNYVTAAWATVWPLAQSAQPNWMYPATTNMESITAATATNLFTISLYAVATMNPQGAFGDTIGANYPIVETTSTFTWTVNCTGSTPIVLTTNLPVAFLQHAKHVYAKVVTSDIGTGNIINQLGILQPQ
jgi:hypothetical protein